MGISIERMTQMDAIDNAAFIIEELINSGHFCDSDEATARGAEILRVLNEVAHGMFVRAENRKLKNKPLKNPKYNI